nr:TetR family transcriptional regulator [Micromonospora sp. DSM 115978]
MDSPAPSSAPAASPASAVTRQRLIDGAWEAVRRHGIAGVSARTVAAAAGVNQALVFYHFGTVDGLLSAACQSTTAARVDFYRDRFAAVSSAGELLQLGRELHETERDHGHVAVLAQLLAGAQVDARLAAPVRDALHLWTAEIETVL